MPAFSPIAIVLAGLAQAPPSPLEPVGRLDHPAIREASGIVASRRHPGIFWVHNDSGNPPLLFAVKRDGSLVREYAVTAANLDWEDIAIDDEGHLYLGDIGNNDGWLPIRAIYRLDEPDPSRRAEGPLPVTRASYYRFPRGGRFDAEGLFIDRGRAVVVAKTFDDREAGLFAVPLDPAPPLIRPALPEPLGTLPEFTEPATGASLSADGRRLAVCSTVAARVYEKDGRGGWSLRAAVRYRGATDIEAIGWDGRDLVLAGEGRNVYRISEAAWRARAVK
ncbi:MAG TPA: hypothetical protein VKP69_13330 [Isosphaeraceae bacterium]|nr:hypothetical protein [Isosphaeraceae bacterium]